jgi:hypothetical protein
MKQIIFSFFAIILFVFSSAAQHANEIIGINDNGVFKITSSLYKIKSDWGALLKSQQNEATLERFRILQGKDSLSNNRIFYYLLGESKSHKTKVATLLTLEGGNFYLQQEKAASLSGTITCTGCANGCNPKISRGKWYCDAGCGKLCTKSVTVTTD